MEGPPDLDPQPPGRSTGRGCRCSADFCRCVVGECLCTFFFILIAGTVDIDWSNGNTVPCTQSPNEVILESDTSEYYEYRTVQVALTMGLAVGTLTQCFELISGAHMNPAVTLAFMVTRQVSLTNGLFYILVQFLGAFTAVLMLRGFLPLQIQGNLGYTTPSPLVTSHQAFGMELLATFLFVFAMLASTDKNNGVPKLQSIQIGAAYALVTFWAFSFTGANMNPVRTVAPAIVLRIAGKMWLPMLEIYVAGPLLGAISSALIYRYVFNMHKKSLDTTGSQRGSSIYDAEVDPNLVSLQRITSYRGKMVSEM